MRARPAASPAFRLVAESGGRAPLLVRAARLVAAGPSGTGLLVEGPLPNGAWRLVAGAPGLHAALRSLGTEFPGALEEEAGGPAPRPGRARSAELFGVAVPGVAAVRPAAPALVEVPVPPDLWLGFQSHWFPAGDGLLRRHRRYRLAGPAVGSGAGAFLATAALAGAATIAWRRGGWLARRRWATGALPRRFGDAPEIVAPEDAACGLVGVQPTRFPTAAELERHLVVFGASGSGKTSFLARLAARAIRAGDAVLVVDVHGDLAPSVLGRLGPPARRRVVALEPDAGGPGVPILDGGGGSAEREAAFVVAALKRLSSDGPELYWGFRLERIFETFVRIAQAEGGTLLDVHALLTDVRRREASRLATGAPVIAAFLDELPAILRRNPEFLWPAAARLAKIALSPDLSALLAPGPPSAVPLGTTLRGRGAVIVRLPIDRLGPEASAFAATLVLTRAYLELTADPRPDVPVLVVLDEATAFSPRLVAEILTEGRKFGVRAVLATQYPERLAPEVRHAAAGSAGTHAVFQVPLAAAAATGAWLGLAPDAARRALAGLPRGWALVAPVGSAGALRTIVERPPPSTPDPAGWALARAATRAAYPPSDGPTRESPVADAVEEAILLALFGADGAVATDRLVGTGAALPVEESAARLARLGPMARRGWIEARADGYALTAAGAGYLGARADHGSASESTEHRRLLLDAFRILARHGERLELMRQGRFDTRLPDARLVLVAADRRGASPGALEAHLARRRRDWAWRYFGGRDVHVEAEVSGAERPERIRRDWEKARRAAAFALFLVPDARRARRVAATLARANAPRAQWGVWTLAADRRASANPPGSVA